MKLFLNISKKHFSVTKYIKPKHNQEYYNNSIYNKYKDRVYL